MDLNSKWNDYNGRLYLWNGSELYTVAPMHDDDHDYDDDYEADEDDWFEDNAWVVDIYGTDDNIIQGGCWTEGKPIRKIDYTIQGVIDRLGGCDLWADDWKFVPDDEEAYKYVDLVEAYWETRHSGNADKIAAAKRKVEAQEKILDELVKDEDVIPQ